VQIAGRVLQLPRGIPADRAQLLNATARSASTLAMILLLVIATLALVASRPARTPSWE
jgi:hypothetical protein